MSTQQLYKRPLLRHRAPEAIFAQVIEDTTTASKGDDVITIADLEAVAAHIPELLRVEGSPAVERGGDRLPDGAIQMPYLDYTPEALRLLQALERHHVTVVFDWMSWQDEARAYLDPEKVATASLEDVRRLLTLHMRKERFCEGHMAEMIRSGHIVALLRRLDSLAAVLRAGAGRTRLRVEQGDITRIAADAIVNAANSALSGGGGVDGAIHRAAGPELLAACRALGRCPTGEARLTPGFRLSAKWVIHAVGPVWSGGDAGEPSLLASAYRASLSLVHAHGCRTVAFPAISCGAYGYPVEDATALAVSTIRDWCDVHPGIDEVILVAYERKVTTALARALG